MMESGALVSLFAMRQAAHPAFMAISYLATKLISPLSITTIALSNSERLAILDTGLQVMGSEKTNLPDIITEGRGRSDEEEEGRK